MSPEVLTNYDFEPSPYISWITIPEEEKVKLRQSLWQEDGIRVTPVETLQFRGPWGLYDHQVNTFNDVLNATLLRNPSVEQFYEIDSSCQLARITFPLVLVAARVNIPGRILPTNTLIFCRNLLASESQYERSRDIVLNETAAKLRLEGFKPPPSRQP